MKSMSRGIIFGLVVGFGALIFGHVFEGGHIESLLQFTAAFIVFGGTAGAVLVSHPFKDIRKSWWLLTKNDKKNSEAHYKHVFAMIVDCAKVARKETLSVLEQKIPKIPDPFVQKVLRTIMDGVSPMVTREIYLAELEAEESEMYGWAKVWSDAGGFSPTIGIIGAVLGLIHVMSNLSDTKQLGSGIAVAFVATIYGVGLANLVFLPFSNRLKKKIAHIIDHKRALLKAALLVRSDESLVVIHNQMESVKVEIEKQRTG